jgi:hypothetical protein
MSVSMQCPHTPQTIDDIRAYDRDRYPQHDEASRLIAVVIVSQTAEDTESKLTDHECGCRCPSEHGIVN